MPSPSSSARHPLAEAGVGVAAQERHEIGAGGEQRRVDRFVAGELADPGRDRAPRPDAGCARDRRPTVAWRRRRRRLALLDRDEDLLGDRAACVPIVDAAAWPSSLSVDGARCEMPRMARSGSTWRTGTSRRIARRSRHAATDGRRRGARAQRAGVLQPQPGVVGAGAADRLGAQFLARVDDPVASGRWPTSLAAEPVVHLEQVLDVGGGVLHLVVGQRPAQPVGEPIALGRRHTDLALQQRHQRRRAVAGEPGGDLRVEHPRRDRPGGVGQHVEVLLGGVDDAQRVGRRTAARTNARRPPAGR